MELLNWTMNIKIKQHDITDCGAACLASISEYYKLRLPISRIRQLAGTDQKGTNIYGLITAAEKLGFSAKGVKGGSEALLKIPLPAIAHIIVKEVLYHYVVIYKAKNNSIEYMDPVDGRLHMIGIKEFDKIWTGVLVLFSPSNNFQQGNKKVSILRRFMYLVKPHRSVIYQSLFGAIIYTLLGLSTSLYIQKITDNVLVYGNRNLLNLLSISMIIVLLLQVFIGVTKSVFMLRTGQQIDSRLILGYYKHLLKLPQRFFDTMRVGEIISRINDAVKIRAFINEAAISIIVNFFIILFSFCLMFLYSWELAIIICLVVPLYVLVYGIVNKLNKRQERKLMESSAEVESQLVESLNSVKTIKQFGLEDFANLKTEVRFIMLLKKVYASGKNSILAGNSSEFLSKIFTIIILWVGSGLVINTSITPGELIGFYAVIGYFTGPTAELVNMNKTIQKALIAADRLFEIMDLKREEFEDKIELKPNLIDAIRFEKVSFSYGSRVDVFKNFNLTIKKGSITAIIGESGSGKTTIASLIQRLYTLNFGHIFIGSYNINYFTNESIRNIISSVPQQLNLFTGNVIENIAVGDYSPNMERIFEICNLLGLLEFIEKLPAGFTTSIGENGMQLSGGQRQRLAIARALYRNPEILILDEATSSLDSESEKYVQQTVHQLKSKGKTIILIAHRLSSVINSDEIVVLKEGKLIEQGNHVELFNKKCHYFNMWQKQIPNIDQLLVK